MYNRHMKTKYVVIIQCDIALRRCSGFACTNTFHNKEDKFSEYDDETKYISFSCDGCCGKAVSSKLGHFSKLLDKKTEIKKSEVAVHLSSCMSTDNAHYDRCPHIDYIKDIIKKRGYENVVEGSYISVQAEKLRENGVYKKYE